MARPRRRAPVYVDLLLQLPFGAALEEHALHFELQRTPQLPEVAHSAGGVGCGQPVAAARCVRTCVRAWCVAASAAAVWWQCVC